MRPGELVERPRETYVDHVRIALSALVVVYHLSTVYGNVGRWPYREPASDLLTETVYGLPFAIVQAFLMPLWFLVAGYFSARALVSRGPREFMAQRLVRLGIPLLIHDLLIQPSLWYINQRVAGSESRPLWVYLFNPPFSEGFGSGPLWYLLELLMFSAVLALIAVRKPAWIERPIGWVPTIRHIMGAGLVIAAGAFLVRLVAPMTQILPILNLPLGDWPKHIGMFVIGVFASRGNWLSRTSVLAGAGGLGVTLGMLAALPPVLAISVMNGGELNPAAFMGGWSWQAAFYAAFDSLVAVGMCSFVIIIFRERLSQRTRLTRLSDSSYAVYLIHTPVTVAVGYAMSGIAIHPILKWFMASLVAVPACFAIAHYLLRPIPLFQRILFAAPSRK